MLKVKMIQSLLLVSILTFSLGMPLFATGQSEKLNDPLTIQIAYPVAVDAPVTDILNEYAKEYMALHPDVIIEPVYAGGYNDVKITIQTTIDGGGKAPALAVMLATDIYDLANAKYIESISPYLENIDNKETYLNDFLPVFMENSYYMDQIWSLPFQRSAVVLYYNADMLKNNGLTVPNSWKTLAETASALTVKENGQITKWGMEYPSSWPYWLFQPLALGAGQNIVGNSDSKVYFNNKSVIKAINYFKSLSTEYKAIPAGVQSSWGNAVSDFVAGNRGIIVHSSGSLSSILSQANFKVGVIGVPGEKANTSYTVPGGGNIYMMQGLNEEEKKVAVDFAVFITDSSRAAKFSIATGYIATRKSSLNNTDLQAYIKENPQVREIQNILSSAGKEFSVQNLGEVRTIFHKYLEATYNGEYDAETAMELAQKEADKALSDFK